MKRRSRLHRAFSLLEVLVSLTILALIGAMVLPGFNNEHQLRVMAAASILTSDIEYAQVLNITTPDMPVIVRIDPDNARYWLAYEWSPNTPIPREDTGEPYLVEFGTGRASAAQGVSITVVDPDHETFGFDPQGSVKDAATAPVITLTQGTESITTTIALSTGSISQASP